MKRFLLVLALAIFTLNSFAQSNTSNSKITAYDQSQSLEVFVSKKGKIEVNGKKISLADLEKQLLELKKRKGFVKFERRSLAGVIGHVNSDSKYEPGWFVGGLAGTVVLGSLGALVYLLTTPKEYSGEVIRILIVLFKAWK